MKDHIQQHLPDSNQPMKAFHRFICSILSCAALLFGSGCATLAPSRPAGEFVRSISFSPLDTFSYRSTELTGMTVRDADEESLKALSQQVLTEALIERGFEALESGGDFYVIAKWNKQLSASANIFDSVDGPAAALNRGNNGAFATAVSYTLTVEIYETANDQLFWRAELPNIFDAIQYSSERVELSLNRAIQQFPDHIEKDPNLPNLE
jgi:hypothetical protein